ncbi:cytochrome-c oxidase, cbb3-type subunit III [Phreatobacter sp.]|uniref:cytochrome-c oxidase, cbb3-type subunit III n=1 Tax=Phreatobacter sp. TaxID=1966341 RepID=UPI003F7194C9
MADHMKPEIDAATGRSTTGHEWDGIKELNSPLPKWWLYIFYATIVWSIGYWIVYPAWPLVTTHTKGLFGYSSRQDVAQDLDALRTLRAGRSAALASTPLPDIAKDPALLTFALAQGKAAFGDNCAPCHGTSATGSPGYPNLRDDVWLWGGRIEDIHQTIAHGIRNADDRSRQGPMPAFGGPNGALKPEEIVQVANFVRQLSGQSTRAGVDLAKGRELFATNCSSCHGDEGRGNQELGAPNLTTPVAIYGLDERTIIQTITQGRAGVMPGWAGRLDETTVKALAVYVHALGGGR